MPTIPDDALVVRGGENLPTSFVRGTGVIQTPDGFLDGVSVNAGAGVSLTELTMANSVNGYPGILNGRIGVTTVGAIRAAGGTVEPTPTRNNPYHATLSGLTPVKASELFTPTTPNSNRGRGQP